ncbi:G-type lectin S-receptor-like serine/threonine-protein kinase LECRK3 [Dioscorea cayenensis subsp. rotundata]|uniref:Receptor-like serine/threonine-protein kinase n=1 Tax=Dioscorea cayennensis subsp. rotundata TaxID=55577 RepID=A0AB40BER5_DIOCR|nr:G-type lectin S-receptor-like serine/threonine-protein kinase LECRK3 [Dioscorea cayenensis subsp. rotundata]
MANFFIIIFFFFFFFFFFSLHGSSVHSQTIKPNITPGSSINSGTNDSWTSPSGHFSFGFYPTPNGFFIGVWLQTSSEKTIIWTANRDDTPITTGSIRLSFDGRLLWSAAGGQETVISNPPEPAAGAAMLDSGNFVLVNSAQKVVWSTFSSPTDTIVPGQTLNPNTQLVSSSSENDPSTGRFRLTNQNDGNLVLYPMYSTNTIDDAYWDSGTYQIGFLITLNLDVNGVLYLSGNNSAVVKNLTQPKTFTASSVEIYHRAVIDVDGILRVYYHSLMKDGSWETGVEWVALSDKCLVKGVCGLNSYCSLVDDAAVCLCPPGFDFVDSYQRSLGCTRSFSGGDCLKDSNITMVELKNTTWVDKTYSIFPSGMSRDDCEAKCMDDCFCKAVLFKSTGECSKQLLPLRYGRMGGNDTVFIKLAAVISNSSSEQHGNNKTTTLLLIISVIFSSLFFILLLFAVFLIFVIRHQRKHLHEKASLNEESPLKSYSYQELEDATNGFREELGRGAFGVVFKGSILSINGEKTIAVKRLQKMVDEGEKEFQREVKAIARTHHRNLVQLLGFCNEGSNRLLVYEYMGNGSLADLLFKRSITGTYPNWKQRTKIAIDVARGLHYLHEEVENHIIHCDIKPQNILIDKSENAKISDFGLAKLLMPEQTKTFTGIRGTRGYLAPEWHKNVAITVKADVFSFGVLLFEIICCKRNMEMEEQGMDCTLVEWVYECFEEGDLRKVLSGEEEVDMVELERMVMVGLWCVHNDPGFRPSMKNVVPMLEGNMIVPRPPLVPPTSFY